MAEVKDDRTYPERPLVGVGGIVFQGNCVLLVRRRREPGRGQWSIPGGVVKLGETLTQAVQRELKEETGLEVEIFRPVEILDRIIPGKDGRILYHYVLIDYLCRIRQGTLQSGSDADQAGFYPLESLDKMDLTPGTRGVILKAFQLIEKGSRVPGFEGSRG